MINTCFVHNLNDGNDPVNLCNVITFSLYANHGGGSVVFIGSGDEDRTDVKWSFSTFKETKEVFNKLISLKSQAV